MNEPQPPVGKMISGIDGLGTVTREMVEQRARELAKMDGRTQPNEADRILAKTEFEGTVDPQTPEVPPEIESVTTWDESPASSGIQATTVLPEDEANIDETLVEEGLEEADHPSRLAAAEENPPSEG